MPPSTVKTVKDTIFWQYAGLMTEAAAGRRDDWGLRMSFLHKLRSGEIVWSTAVREWLLEQENPSVCMYCGAEGPLTVEHILPRSRGGEDVPENVVRVCKACNSSKGAKGLYEWKGLDAKNSHHRIAEGKYLKYLYSLHEKSGTLDLPLAAICPCCLQPRCEQEKHAQKLTVYCIEVYFAPKEKKTEQ